VLDPSRLAAIADELAEADRTRTLADLEALASWTARPAAERPFLLLDCRISGRVVAPYQEEIIRVNS
jgi:hypothetical protein